MSTGEFNSMVLYHSPGLKPFAISLTRDREAANDLFQETMYKAFAYRTHFKTGANMKAWLYTIMRNLFINDYRRAKHKITVMQVVKQSTENFSPSTEAIMGKREIDKAVHSLPPIFKKTCLLYLDGYKYNEIAHAMNEPIGTVKSRIHFAKKMLQKQLER